MNQYTCLKCGQDLRYGLCKHIKEIEYTPAGNIKRLVFHDSPSTIAPKVIKAGG